MQAARLLIEKSFRLFRETHQMFLRSQNSLDVNEHLRAFGEAVERESLAIEWQREALDLRRRAFEMQAKSIARLKAELEA